MATKPTATLIGTRGTSATSAVSTVAGTSVGGAGKYGYLVVSFDAAVTISSVVDSKGNTFTLVGAVLTGAGKLARYICADWVGGATHSVTVNFSAAAFATAHLVEVTDTNGLDAAASGSSVTSSSTPWTVASNALKQFPALAMSGIELNTGSPGAYSSANLTILSSEPDVANFWTSAVGSLDITTSLSAVTASWDAANRSQPQVAARFVDVFKFNGPSAGRSEKKIESVNSGSVPCTTPAIDTSGGLLLSLGARGVIADFGAGTDTDNKGNGNYTLQGSSHAYTGWPNSGTAVYAKTGAASGAGHTNSQSRQTVDDEISNIFAEFLNVDTVAEVKWLERLTSPNLSDTITVTGPALLVAFWAGDDSLGNTGFSALSAGWGLQQFSNSVAGNHIQVAYAARAVDAGTYSIEWTPNVSQGAQLYIIALTQSGGGAPSIDVQPTDQTAAEGGTATFTATVTGATSLQWEHNDGAGWVSVSGGTGGTTNTHVTGALNRATHGGRLYRLAATSAGGTTYSSIVLLRVTAIPATYSGDGFVIGASYVGEGMIGAPNAAVNSDLAGNAVNVQAMTGAATTSINAAGAAVVLQTTTSALTNAIQAAVAAIVNQSATGNISTALQAATALQTTQAATGALQGNPQLASASANSQSVNVALTTGLNLAGVMSNVASSSGIITTQISVRSDAIVNALMTGAIQSQIAAAANLVNQQLSTGALTTSNNLAASAVVNQLSTGNLTTEDRLAVTMLVLQNLNASLTAQIQFNGAMFNATSMSGTLDAGGGAAVTLAGDMAVVQAMSGAMQTQMRLVGAATVTGTATGDIANGILMAATGEMQQSATGNIQTQTLLATVLATAGNGNGSLTVSIQLKTDAIVEALMSGGITTIVQLASEGVSSAAMSGALADNFELVYSRFHRAIDHPRARVAFAPSRSRRAVPINRTLRAAA